MHKVNPVRMSHFLCSFCPLCVLCAFVVTSAGSAAEFDSHFAKLGDVRIHYQSLGTGDSAVVLIHGWTCDSTFWKRQVSALAGKGRLLLIDLPGHGKSDKPKVDYTMAYFARAIAAMLDDAGVKSAVLVGHSMGTPVARQFYRLYPKRTRAIVAVDGALHREVDTQAEVDRYVQQFSGPDYKEQIAKTVETMFAKSTPAGDRRHILTTMQSAPQHVVASAMKGMLALDIWKADDPIGVPLLVVVAKQPYWPADHEQRVKKLNAKAEYRALDGAGHFLMVDKPETFNKLLLDFLAQVSALKD